MFFSGSFEKSVVFLNNKLDIQIVSTDLGLEEKPFCGVDILVPIEVNDDIAIVPVGLNLKSSIVFQITFSIMICFAKYVRTTDYFFIAF